MQIQAEPWGPVARRVEQVLAYSRPYGVAMAMERVIARSRDAADASERQTVAAEVDALVRASGLSRAEFASRIGTSPSRLSTYATGKVTPSAALLARMRRAAGCQDPRALFRHGLSRVSVLPQGADRHRPEPVAKWQRALPRIEQDAAAESLAALVAQRRHRTPVARSERGRCLDLDADDLPAAALENEVNLAPPTPVMEEPRIRLRPVCVASHLHRHEILQAPSL